MIHLIPTTTSLSSLRLAEIYKKEIWRTHGIPRRIISNRGPQFASKFMKELCNGLGIERNLSTAYHPQTDSQTKRINQEIETYVMSFPMSIFVCISSMFTPSSFVLSFP
jgi:transposase InsO family protein